jgi:hypothetical protein
MVEQPVGIVTLVFTDVEDTPADAVELARRR